MRPFIGTDTQERQITDAVMLREYAEAAREREDHVGSAVLENLAQVYESGTPYLPPSRPWT